MADAPWAALGAAPPVAVAAAWLALLQRRLGAAMRAGLVLLPDAGGSYVPVAAWPPGLDASYLGESAQAALNSATGVRHPQPDGSLHAAYPLVVKGRLAGLVLVHLAAAPAELQRLALEDLHWGAGWLAEALAREASVDAERRLEQAGFLLELLAAVVAQGQTRSAWFEFVNRLAVRLGCHQVLLGREKAHTVEVVAMSHAAWFDERSSLLQQAAQAMNEAFDQRLRTVVQLNDSASDTAAAATGAQRPHAVTVALRAYAAASDSIAACAVPLEDGGALAGVCLLQRDVPFNAAELELLDLAATTLGPPLALIAARDESLAAHARRSVRWALSRLGDGSHPGWKLAAAAAALVLAVLAFWPVDWRVNARAVLEGSVQQAAAAPFAGFIQSAPARAGDLVKRGQVLAVLDDKELRLEAERLSAELQIAEKRERESRAQGERAELRLATAQAAQARAQLALTEDRLARVQLLAPFDGVVVRGDLSQQLGTPVELGKVLFEIAPLAAWRVILQVDERDIAYIAEQRQGELRLASLPGDAWPLSVARITPVSVAEQGRNHFRVEAELQIAVVAQMRPGMEGVAKVDAGSRSLLWIWTHRFTDWLRLVLWQWWP